MVDIELYEDQIDWDKFVDESNNGTLFHKQSFLNYHPKKRFNFRNLIFNTIPKGKPLALMTGGIDGDVYKSPLGASYGGFIVPKYFSIEQADKVVKAFIDWCKDKGIKEAFITPPMNIYQDIYDDVMSYAMMYNHFLPITQLYSSVIDLNVVHDRSDLDKKRRYLVNHAEKSGVEVVENGNYLEFYNLLLKNKTKFDAKPVHTLLEIKKIGGKLFSAIYKGRLIGGIWLLEINKNCALLFYCASDEEFKNLNPVNLLVEQVTNYCFEKGYRYLDYGVSADTFSTDPLEPSWSLVKFKERMRCSGCIRQQFYRRMF